MTFVDVSAHYALRHMFNEPSGLERHVDCELSGGALDDLFAIVQDTGDRIKFHRLVAPHSSLEGPYEKSSRPSKATNSRVCCVADCRTRVGN